MSDKENNMTTKINKDERITVRLNEIQMNVIAKLIADGKATTNSSAIQYLLNELAIKGSK